MPRKRKDTQKFISECKSKHGDKYDYSKTKYVDSQTRVCVICHEKDKDGMEHGEFYQFPSSHLQGYGCKKCALEKLSRDMTYTQDEFISKSQLLHASFYDYSKVKYINSHTDVCIICPIHGEFWQKPDIHLRGCGCPHCRRERRKRKVCGVGKNDLLYTNKSRSYKAWHSMLSRCYKRKFKNTQKCYNGVTVCEEWLTFSNFKRWFDENYIEGYHLDKDILVKGNKVYSPDTCCFVPRRINVLTTIIRDRINDLPVGVQKAFGDKYTAHLSKIDKYEYCGIFNDVDSAFVAYKTAKEAYIKEVAQEYYDRGEITKKVYDALMRYEVEFN